jgi:F-type H+-transporting ATPase subunit gamma
VFHCIYNGESQNLIQTKIIKPLEEFKTEKILRFSYPLYLQIPNDVFLFDLLEQYFFAFLHLVFYQSFQAENRERFRHLEAAIERLKDQKSNLIRRLNSLRQEQITEELQVIMLSARAILAEFSQDDRSQDI